MIALWGIHSYVFIAVYGAIILIAIGVSDCREEIRKEREAEERKKCEPPEST